MARKLKGPFNNREDWLKFSENLGAAPFKWDLSNDTTSSQTNLAGQSLLTRYVVHIQAGIKEIS